MIDKLKYLKNVPNSAYYDLKYKFNYHSNKIEGSTFLLENMLSLMQYNTVEGNHPFDDVMETKNSLELFDFVVDTLGEKISKTLLFEYHSILKKGTKDEAYGFKGCYKKVPNMILGAKRKIAQPYEVEKLVDDLIVWYYGLNKVTLKEIAEFHLRFESIHPFQDGNERIGRFLILKQCVGANINPILINSDNVSDYRKAMNGDVEEVYEFLTECQQYPI